MPPASGEQFITRLATTSFSAPLFYYTRVLKPGVQKTEGDRNNKYKRQVL
jgi:hypothetical protein